jgi:hypothetical protein
LDGKLQISQIFPAPLATHFSSDAKIDVKVGVCGITLKRILITPPVFISPANTNLVQLGLV